jgi:hypothetical protein
MLSHSSFSTLRKSRANRAGSGRASGLLFQARHRNRAGRAGRARIGQGPNAMSEDGEYQLHTEKHRRDDEGRKDEPRVVFKARGAMK